MLYLLHYNMSVAV
jgi:hypothetical protein